MNNDYICMNCHAIFHEEDLEDNADGICLYCGCPLESLHTESYYPIHTIGKEEVEYIGKGADLMNTIKNLKTYPMDEIWHSIELLKNVKDRTKERALFFKALKILNKKFELLED